MNPRRASREQQEEIRKHRPVLTDEQREAIDRRTRLWAELDRRFPKVRSREVVEHDGKRYIRRFTPLRVSNSGKTVMEWGRYWEEKK